MAVLQMQRMSICALKKDRKAILEKLQHMGVMEINHILEEDEDFRKMNTANARSGFEKAAASADQALHLLHQYAPVKQSLLSSLEGKDLVDKEKYRSVIENRDDLQRTARRIQALDKERAEHRANILKIENSIESLMPWLPLNVPVAFGGTEHIVMLPGTPVSYTHLLRRWWKCIITAGSSRIHYLCWNAYSWTALPCMKNSAGTMKTIRFICSTIQEL